ncbi:MAG: hypothetical protein M3Y13_14275 [Armatimonadota bacterium]|nr:hypothetical protein [Armatimonadota bacterium]
MIRPTAPLPTTLDRLLTIRAVPVRGLQARLPGGLVIPTHRFQWYYAAQWPDGSVAATLHLGEGIVPAREAALWRILQRSGIRTLLKPVARGTEPLASYFAGGQGPTGPVFRLTEGDSRSGGFDILGKGWRGGVLLRHTDKARSVLLRGEGDPPDVYFLEPVASAPQPLSLPAALLVAYVLIEREVKEGSWIKRPVALPEPPPVDEPEAENEPPAEEDPAELGEERGITP